MRPAAKRRSLECRSDAAGQAYRTGRLAHLKREVFARVFDVPIEADQPVVFVEPGVIEKLQAMSAPED